MEADGAIAATGDVTYRVNPPVIDPANSGVQFLGMQTTIRVAEDGSVRVNLVGRASYADRTATQTLEIQPTPELVDAISQMIANYGTQVHNASIAAAAEAMGVAHSKGELQ